jgi:hypothetical protein
VVRPVVEPARPVVAPAYEETDLLSLLEP